MDNLAGKKDCDRVIERELVRCGIEVVRGARPTTEVPASVTGRLGEFTFRRAWYYYVVHGLVPLAVAKELYADPVGKDDVRVDGHCGCPAPEDPWLTYRAPDGREVWGLRDREAVEAFRKSGVNHPTFEAKFSAVVFDDDRTKYAAFVDCYHIDSEVGLRLFADTIKRHKLDVAEVPPEECCEQDTMSV